MTCTPRSSSGPGWRWPRSLAGTALPGRVRLVFQPAEEVMPGGALDVIEAGLVDSADLALAVHCDPSLEVGRVGLRSGPITAASDMVTMRLHGPGGHTSRPHNTVDLIYALGQLLTALPAALTRRIDPRAAVTLVWGMVQAGSVANAIPQTAIARGTVRVLDRDTWATVPDVLDCLAQQIVAPYGATLEIDHKRGVPPVVNDARAVALLTAAAGSALGPDAGVDHVAVTGRRGLRLVPGEGSRGDGPARRAPARSRTVRPASAGIRRRRALHRRRGPLAHRRRAARAAGLRRPSLSRSVAQSVGGAPLHSRPRISAT